MNEKVVDLVIRAEKAAAFVRTRLTTIPSVAVVLGSGMESLVEMAADPLIVPFREIPHFPTPTVDGHPGNLVIGEIERVPTILLQGRPHYYEGHGLETVTFPVRVLQQLGVSTLILTAATGGIRDNLRPGDIVCVEDHLNLQGSSPLRGAHDDRLGARFPDMSCVYSKRLRAIAREEAGRLGLSLATGVYACLSGPNYETPAEIRMLRTLGADVVGMSTVPEAIVACQAGMETLAFALVTNAAAGLGEGALSHGEVMDVGARTSPVLCRLIQGVIRRHREDVSDS